jgi:hypothetical protein
MPSQIAAERGLSMENAPMTFHDREVSCLACDLTPVFTSVRQSAAQRAAPPHDQPQGLPKPDMERT